MAKLKLPTKSKITLVSASCIIVVGALVMTTLEIRARNQFTWNRVKIDSVVSNAIQPSERDVKRSWLRDASANPTFAAFVDKYPPDFDVVGSLCVFGDPQDAGYGCLYQSWSWEVVFSAPPPAGRDLTQIGTSADDGSRTERVNVRVVISRRVASLFSQTPIQIVEKPAPDNDLLVNRLTAGFAENRLAYEIVQQ